VADHDRAWLRRAEVGEQKVAYPEARAADGRRRCRLTVGAIEVVHLVEAVHVEVLVEDASRDRTLSGPVARDVDRPVINTAAVAVRVEGAHGHRYARACRGRRKAAVDAERNAAVRLTEDLGGPGEVPTAVEVRGEHIKEQERQAVLILLGIDERLGERATCLCLPQRLGERTTDTEVECLTGSSRGCTATACEPDQRYEDEIES